MPFERKSTINLNRRRLEQLRITKKPNEPKRRVAIEAQKRRILNHENIQREFLQRFMTFEYMAPNDPKILSTDNGRITLKLGQFFDQKTKKPIYIIVKAMYSKSKKQPGKLCVKIPEISEFSVWGYEPEFGVFNKAKK